MCQGTCEISNRFRRQRRILSETKLKLTTKCGNWPVEDSQCKMEYVCGDLCLLGANTCKELADMNRIFGNIKLCFSQHHLWKFGFVNIYSCV
jgi:hypothetical protein